LAVWPPAKPLATDLTPGSRSKTASMHQKQPPPNVADSVLFVFMALVDCASADKFSAAKMAKMQGIGVIF
jgi:hypothetical protein